MPLPPASERGIGKPQPEVILARDIDIREIARVADGEIFGSQLGGSGPFYPDRMGFAQEGVALIVGRPVGPIIEFPYQAPKRKLRRTPKSEQKRFVVDAVVMNEAANSVTFVSKVDTKEGHTTGLVKVTLERGQEAKISGTEVFGAFPERRAISAEDAQLIVAISAAKSDA